MPDASILLIEARGTNAGGLAYSSMDDNLVLNVPSGNMSAFPAQPNHFKEYIERYDGSLNGNNFVSRRLYGQYLQDCLEEEMLNHEGITIIHSKLLEVKKSEFGKYRLYLSDCHPIDPDYVVFAMGHLPSKPIGSFAKIGPYRLGVTNIVGANDVDDAKEDDDVLIVGTGHTAVDAFFRLESSGVRGRTVYMLSRHGLLPNGHRPIGEFKKDPEVTARVTRMIRAAQYQRGLRGVFQTLRVLVKALEADWRDIINAMRPMIPEIWSCMNERERKQFMRHLVHYWDVHRHRIAPAANERLNRAIKDGRLKILSGRLLSVGSVAVQTAVIRTRSNSKHYANFDDLKLEVGTVINCTGPNYDFSKTSAHNSIFTRCMRDGFIKQDALKLGIETNGAYQTNPDEHPNLYYIGPMLKAKYWEAIAVPELRVHAVKLAQIIKHEAEQDDIETNNHR
jgi:uncharacterized NAD(P)/FAD-binding protein YdhS